MKQLKIILFVALLSPMFSSCIKRDIQLDAEASVILINAATQMPALQVKLTNKPFPYGFIRGDRQAYFGNYGMGDNGTKLYGVPVNRSVPLTIFSDADTLHPIYDNDVIFSRGDVYSLYIAGLSDSLATVLIKEQSFPIRTETTMAIRFINLSPNAGPISVNMLGQPKGTEADNIDFLGITHFTSYQVDQSLSYIFEFRDANDNVIGSYEFNPAWNSAPTFRNMSLILRGLLDGDPGIQVVRLDHN